MCGLVGLIDPYLAKLDLEVVEQLLYADALRGFHSTGVASFHRDNIRNENKVSIFKDAVPAAYFMSMPEYDDWAAEVLRKNSKIVMGHNRLATRGKINRSSSHPFLVGNIALAHNGSLYRYDNLPNHQYFSVDSHAIAYAIADIGVEETIARLDGSFALTWIDVQKGTFNLVRNAQRPLCLRTNSSNTRAAWASEELMLDWILDRKHQLVGLKDRWEIEPGHWLEFDLLSRTPADFKLWELELYKHKTYSTPTKTTHMGNTTKSNRKGGKQQQRKAGGNPGVSQSPIIIPGAGQNKQLPAASNDGGGEPTTNSQQGLSKRQQQKAAKLDEFGLTYRQEFRFHAYAFTPYSASDPNSLGFIDGNMERDPYLAVEIHQIRSSDFIEQATYVAKATAISNYNTYDTLIGCDLELAGLPDSHPAKDRIKHDHSGRVDIDAESAPPFDEDEKDTGERFIGPTGRQMTRTDMDFITRHGCCNCDDVIQPEEYDSIGWTQSGAPLCKGCQDQYDGIFIVSQGGRVH